MTPYHSEKWVTIYHGDCREILPQLDIEVDLVLTDPPYPCEIRFLGNFTCPQLIFWTPRLNFPLPITAINVWDKIVGTICQFEMIYEVNGTGKNFNIYRYQKIHNKIDAQMNNDTVINHVNQKPQRLISKLIEKHTKPNGLILDPFLGSGTTCCCAKKLNRYSIGIEIEEKYCEIAAKRCSQEAMELNL